MRIKIVILVFIIINFIASVSYGTDGIVESQLEVLDMSSIINEGKKYTNEIFPEIHIEKCLTEFTKGNIDNSTIFSGIIKVFGRELVNSITLLGSILAIIVIHSILKNIGENIGNENVSKIAYYVEYILIVTLITANFSQIISNIRESITNLIGFMNSLLPILLALISATGQVATMTVIQPVLLFSIVIIGNIVNVVILPIVIISTTLDIVSNLSDKVQVGKLAKFFKSSAIWCIGFIITIFVGVLSLEGTLTSSIDGITIKGIKTVAGTAIPVVGKALGDSVDTVLRCNIINKKCSRSNRSNYNYRNMYSTNNKISNTKYFV